VSNDYDTSLLFFSRDSPAKIKLLLKWFLISLLFFFSYSLLKPV